METYRESVRTHYHELRTGLREGLPADLARPLTVGQKVIARHPKTREIHDGSILTVDRSRCRVQFDRPELGVELVMVFILQPYHNAGTCELFSGTTKVLPLELYLFCTILKLYENNLGIPSKDE